MYYRLTSIKKHAASAVGCTALAGSVALFVAGGSAPVSAQERSTSAPMAEAAAALSGLQGTTRTVGFDTSVEAQFLDLINRSRMAAGLPALVLDPALQDYARTWAHWISDQQQLSHSILGTLPGAWQRAGENVGYGPSAPSVHDLMMGDAAHQANILDAGFSRVGIGVYTDRAGRVWVCEDFDG